MSGSQASRIERGLHRAVTHDQLVCLGAAVGLEIRIRAYPGAEGPLDRAQLRLLDRLRRLVPSSVEMRTEVGLPDPADQRAWDAVLSGLRDADGSSARLMVEAETRLGTPIDIEAALGQGWQLIQARPITTIASEPAPEREPVADPFLA